MSIDWVLPVLLLLAVLACAVIRPQLEAVVAVPAAVLVIAIGSLSLDHARDEALQLAPVVGFLAAVLVLAYLCDIDGLFQACGAWLARAAAPQRLLAGVFAIASVITAVLSLDATIVLLTPVVFATAARLGARPKPHVYACTHLSNTASLLLPVSNLTNLLAFAASGLSFVRFAALMTLPWLAAIAAEYAVFRWFFGRDLNAGADLAAAAPSPRLPVFTVVTVAGTLAGFVLTSAVGLDPAWAASGGALVLAVRALAQRRTTVIDLVKAASIPFLAFVLALGIVVRAVVDNGLGDALGALIPSGTGLVALLGIAALAAVLANLINNLPAVLVLLPLVAAGGPGAVLAVLLGVNIGPNLTYAGSLATLLWRRILRQHDTDVDLGEFTRLGLLAVPASLLVAVLALWGSLHVIEVDDMAVVVWIVEGTWPACIDAARAHASGDIALLHVTDVSGAAHGAFAGLLGRGGRDPGARLEELAAASPLLEAAAQRLDRPCARLERAGRIEREVVDAAQGADLLIVARDSDHHGPKSLGPATRFVVDHARCPVLLVWP